MNARSIRQLREAAGLSQPQLAKLAGVHADTLGRIENGLSCQAQTLTFIRKALVTALGERMQMLVEANRILHQSA
jgi:transcriptional regulator with XRE-family HTH domain